MCTLCLSKRSKCCNKKSSWISKLPSVWVEDFTCLQEDLPNLKVLERVLRMNNHFYCHSVQSPSSDQWFPGCLSSSKWPCLSRGAWNRWFLEVPSNLKHSVILMFRCAWLECYQWKRNKLKTSSASVGTSSTLPAVSVNSLSTFSWLFSCAWELSIWHLMSQLGPIYDGICWGISKQTCSPGMARGLHIQNVNWPKVQFPGQFTVK